MGKMMSIPGIIAFLVMMLFVRSAISLRHEGGKTAMLIATYGHR